MQNRGKADYCLFSFFYEVEDRIEEEKVYTSFQACIRGYMDMLNEQKVSGFKRFHKLRFAIWRETNRIGKDWWNYREYRGRIYHRETYYLSNRKVERY